MNSLNQIVLLATFIGASWLNPSLGLGGQETSNPSTNSVSPTNDIFAEIITKTPVVMKGLYAEHSGSRKGSLANTSASAVIQGLRWLAQTQNEDGSWGTGTDDLDATTGIIHCEIENATK